MDALPASGYPRVRNVTAEELLGYLNNSHFSGPSSANRSAFYAGTQLVRTALGTHLAGLNINVSQDKVNIDSEVCRPSDNEIRVTDMAPKLSHDGVIMVRQTLKNWLNIRLSLETHAQFPAFLEFLKETGGRVSFSQIRSNRGVCRMLTVMQRIARRFSFNATDKKLQRLCWRFIAEFLAKAAELDSVSFNDQSDEESGVEEDDLADQPALAPNGPLLPEIPDIPGLTRRKTELSRDVDFLIGPITSMENLLRAVQHERSPWIHCIVTTGNIDRMVKTKSRPEKNCRQGDHVSFMVTLTKGKIFLQSRSNSNSSKKFQVKSDGDVMALELYRDVRFKAVA